MPIPFNHAWAKPINAYLDSRPKKLAKIDDILENCPGFNRWAFSIFAQRRIVKGILESLGWQKRTQKPLKVCEWVQTPKK